MNNKRTSQKALAILLSTALIFSLFVSLGTTSVSAAALDPLISENFNSGAANGWTTYGGTWAVENGEYSLVSGSQIAKSVFNTNAPSNFILEGDIKIIDGGQASLIFCVANPGTGNDSLQGYSAGIDTNNTVWLGRHNNNWTSLGSVGTTITPGTVYRLGIIRSGTNIKVLLNGAVKLDVNDGTFTASAKIGVRGGFGNHAHFDNIRVNTTLPSIFSNPIMGDGADPWVIRKDGYYYHCYSNGVNQIFVRKAQRLQDLGTAASVCIWTAPGGTAYSSGTWAPELHYLDGKWYCYFAADDGRNETHRMYVLEGNSQDPQGSYTFKGKIAAPVDKWAIDGTVVIQNGNKYFLWSGWEGDTNVQQILYIAPMSNPWTISGNRVEISRPDYAWERVGTPYINEGPQVLYKNGTINVIYSASGSWTDSYCLGQLKLTGSNILDKNSWTKKNVPVFSSANGLYGPGHASFTVSPDGTEDWIVYHTAKFSGAGWDRNVRTQRFGWNSDNTPNFGAPSTDRMQEPSGTGAAVTSAGIVNGAVYKLVAQCSGLCLDVPNAVATPVALQQHYDNGTAAQQWRVDDMGGGYYKLTARCSGLCLDVMNASTQPAGVQQYTDNNSSAQRWLLQDMGNGVYKLTAQCSGLCLDVMSASTQPAGVQQYTDNGNFAQRWRLVRVY